MNFEKKINKIILTCIQANHTFPGQKRPGTDPSAKLSTERNSVLALCNFHCI